MGKNIIQPLLFAPHLANQECVCCHVRLLPVLPLERCIRTKGTQVGVVLLVPPSAALTSFTRRLSPQEKGTNLGQPTLLQTTPTQRNIAAFGALNPNTRPSNRAGAWGELGLALFIPSESNFCPVAVTE